MRVLHLTSGNMFGGIEVLLLTLARQQGSCPDMEPHFALCFEGRVSEELRACGAAVNMLGPARISRPWTIWRARRALRQIMDSGHYDIAVTHGLWIHALLAPAVRSQGMPLAFWAHGIHGKGQILSWWASRVRPAVVLCNSEVTRQSVGITFAHNDPVVVYCPVALGSIDRERARRQIRTELNIAENALVIVQACRLERWKGHEILLDALAQLKDLPGWVCCIAGGAQRPEERVYLTDLQRRCEQLGLAQRVRWLGQRQDVPALLAAADIHCQPNSGPEPFGLAFVEALHAGLPVVTTAMGGPREIVTPECGRLVLPDSPVQVAAALREFLLSAELRGRAAEAGPRRAAELCDPARQMGRLATELGRAVRSKSCALNRCPSQLVRE
jgi:glycosyltransferase involved in cell wall biosynthesis